tara:strand:+ start:52 stop:447 length:396 start_codon:yes stop_codon:yes gene_type:complete
MTSKVETKDEFYKELYTVAKISYDKDFYDWMGHSIGYTYDIAVFINENDKFISQSDGTYKRTFELLSLGRDLERYYWQRREIDERDPDLWQPVGYHGTAHTCHIRPKREGECKICKKIALYNKKEKLNKDE